MVSELISVDSFSVFALAIRSLIKCVICVMFFLEFFFFLYVCLPVCLFFKFNEGH